jgi:hypothetical protein
MVAAKLATLRDGQRADLVEGLPIGRASALLNVGERTVARAREVQEHGTPELVSAVERGAVSVSAAAEAPLPHDRRYPIILADPPWKYEAYDLASGMTRAAEVHYPTMTTEEICALAVADLATPDAALFLWATSPLLEDAFRVIEAWGFRYRTNVVWVKESPRLGLLGLQSA